MKLILPLAMTFAGVGIGASAGLFLGSEEPVQDCPSVTCDDAETTKDTAEEVESESDFVRMQNQFVVPVVRSERVQSLVVMSLSLEVDPAATDSVYEREPKLRDSFLRVLFDHAHIGGFDGQFTQSGQLSVLRVALLEAAQEVIGKTVTDILITDIVRQEM